MAPVWTDIAAALPDADTLVLLVLNDDDVWPGYLDAIRGATSMQCGSLVSA